MRPLSAIRNSIHRASLYIILFCDNFGFNSGFSLFQNIFNYFLSQYRAGMRAASIIFVSPFINHILMIIRVSAGKQMKRVNADWIIAGVANVKIYLSDKIINRICYTGRNINAALNTKLSIPGFPFSGLPFPASVGLNFNFFLKAIYVFCR